MKPSDVTQLNINTFILISHNTAAANIKPCTLTLTPCSTVLQVKAESLQLFKTLQASY